MDPYILFKGILLGVVEGITEFIPVSSTGHLILAGDLLGFDDERAKAFEIFIQLGAILSVVWLYREKLSGVLRDLPRRREAGQFLLNLFIAFLPAAFLGFLSHHAIKAYLFNPITVSLALVGGGIGILLIERMKHRGHVGNIDDLTLKQAFGIGMAQCLALFPGVSRSGATIMGGLMIGLERKVATEFSFFLAIPTMFAATAYDLLKNRNAMSLSDIPLFAVGFITAFISALVVVRRFVGFVSRHDFSAFAYYRIIFGAIVLAYYWEAG
ncbi:MAG TPA: undecaprenyl-diphosphate phosphatase, partial [Nitrospiria bacterium]